MKARPSFGVLSLATSVVQWNTATDGIGGPIGAMEDDILSGAIGMSKEWLERSRHYA